MLASKENVKVGNTIIFNCDEFRNNDIQEFDGHVQIVDDEGVHVVYLSGYRSRNDHILWADVLAKLDKRKPYIKLTNATYSGHFVEFTKPVVQQ
jgi:hypothetical protein